MLHTFPPRLLILFIVMIMIIIVRAAPGSRRQSSSSSSKRPVCSRPVDSRAAGRRIRTKYVAIKWLSTDGVIPRYRLNSVAALYVRSRAPFYYYVMRVIKV